MHYDYFIGMIKAYETDKITAFQSQKYNTSNAIPDAFALLIPDVVNLLSKHIDELCESHQRMVIFGLQPAGAMLTSNQPLASKRTLNLKGFQADFHFCCTLEYFLTSAEDIDSSTNWSQTYSLVLDFTSGEMMDTEQYIKRLFSDKTEFQIIGRLPERTLKIVWHIANIKQAQKAKAQDYLLGSVKQDVALAS